MNRNVATMAVAVVAAFAAGLGWSWYAGGPEGGVAIVDLDKVARELGRSDQMGTSLQSAASALQGELSKAQQEAARQLQAAKTQIGDQPTQQDAQAFQNMQLNARMQLNQLQQKATAALSKHQQSLVSDFRSQTKPAAQRIAKERGLTTIMTANDAVVFAFDDAVDITDEVVALMKAEFPAPATPTPASGAPAATVPAQPAAVPSADAPAANPVQEAAAPAAPQAQ